MTNVNNIKRGGVQISVIVPVYNGEKYIKNCLEMLLAQGSDGYEIIVIDDGSTDKTAEIAARFQDNKIVYYRQENKGVSSARNKGIELSDGEWIVFCDVDDVIDEGYISGCFREINKKENTEVICFAQKSSENKECFDISADDALRALFGDGGISQAHDFWFIYVWSKVFKKEFLAKNNIRFNEKISFGEDVLFIVDVFRHATKIHLVPNIYYHYMQNDDSVLHSGYKAQDYENYFECMNSLTQLMSYNNRTQPDSISWWLNYYKTKYGFIMMGRYARGSAGETRSVRKEKVKSIINSIKQNNKALFNGVCPKEKRREIRKDRIKLVVLKCTSGFYLLKF